MDGFYNPWFLFRQCLRSVSLEAEPDTGFECILYWECSQETGNEESRTVQERQLSKSVALPGV